MLYDMIMEKFEILPGDLVMACPSLMQDVAEAFLPMVKASVRAKISTNGQLSARTI